LVIAGIIISLSALLAAAAIGRPIMGLLGLRRRGADSVFFSVAMGLGILTFVMFAAGLAGLFTPLFGRVLLAAALVLTARWWRAALGDLKTLLRRFFVPRGPFSGLLMIAIALTATLHFTCSLAPPTETDALTMHLQAPREYIRAGRMVWLPDALDSPMVMGPHLIYTLLFLVSGGLWADTAPAVLHCLLGFMLVLWIWRFVARYIGKGPAYAATAVFCTMPMITQSAIAPMVDMFLGFYSMAALVSLMRFIRSGRFRPLLAAGLFSAFAAGAKYSGFVTLAAVLVTAACRALTGPRRRAIAARVVAAGVLAVAAAAPFPLRNWCWTGNPVAPAMKSVFGGPGWDTASFERADGADERYERLHHSIGNMLAAPWVLTNRAELASSGMAGTITYTFLLFLPLTVFLRSRRRIFLYLAVYCAATFTLAYWTTGRPRSRYFLSLMPITSLYVAAGLVLLRRYAGAAHRIAGLAVGASVVFGMAVAGLYSVSFAKAVVGATPRDEFLARATDFYAQFKWMGDNLPRESMVLVGATNDLYYLPRRSMRLDSSNADGLAVYALGADGGPRQALERMRGFGITHLFVRRNMVDAGDGRPMVTIFGVLSETGHLELLKAWEGSTGTRNPLVRPRVIPVALYEVRYGGGGTR
jgi:hypothetical protein